MFDNTLMFELINVFYLKALSNFMIDLIQGVSKVLSCKKQFND